MSHPDPARPDPDLVRLRQEAAQLRYELARLRDRRSVRAAMALTSWRREGPGSALRALRGQLPRWDVPGPSVVAPHPPLPQLHVLTVGPGAIVAGAAHVQPATGADAVSLLHRDRPDIVLIDDPAALDAGALASLVAAARTQGAAIVTVGAAARAAVGTPTLHVTIGPGAAGGGRSDAEGARIGAGAGSGIEAGAEAHGQVPQLTLPPPVDVRAWAPIGLDDAHDGLRLDGSREVTVEQARRQPVVVDARGEDPARLLALACAGAIPVTVATATLRAALQGLDETTSTLVLAPEGSAPGAIEERARALLADAELRRRVSVRLRRAVQRRCGTRQLVVELAAALGFVEPAPARVSVLLASRRADRVGQVLDDLAAQRDVATQLVLLVHGDAPTPERLPAGAQVVRIDGARPLGAVLDTGVDHIDGAYVTKMDDDDRYGPDHLGDLVLAVERSGADIVGRRAHGVYLEGPDRSVHPAPGGDERYEDHLPGGTLLLRADTMRAVRWRHVPRAVDTHLLRAIHLGGGSAYTDHRFGYVRVRHDDHTYDNPDGWDGAHVVAGFDPTLLEA